MNKLIIALVTIALIGAASAQIANTAQGYYWTNCQDSLTKYSVWVDGKTAEDLAPYNKLFNCANIYYESSNRKSCEETNKIANIPAEATNFYNDCVVPYYFNYVHVTGAVSDLCGSQSDACLACYLDNTCTTYMTNFQGQTKAAKDIAQQDQLAVNVLIEKCTDITTNCKQTTQKDLAYNSCLNALIPTCRINWLKTNDKDDKCLPYAQCSTAITASSAVLKIAFAALALFFAF